MIRILVADDHSVVRQGIVQIMSGHTDVRVVGEAEDGFAAVQMADPSFCDVVLLDISMPGKNGLEVLKEIKSHHPSIQVLMLSMYPEEQYALRALRHGASGYLTKSSAPDELMSALRKVAAGGKYVTASLAEKLASNWDIDTERPRHELLSDREFQVMCLISY